MTTETDEVAGHELFALAVRVWTAAATATPEQIRAALERLSKPA
jgi:hypothetical protein